MPGAAQLVLDVENAPGALTRVASILRAAGVDIDGVWAFPCPRGGPFFRPADDGARALAEAAERLADEGINIICAYESAGGVRQLAVILHAADVARAAAALMRSADDGPRGERRDLPFARPDAGEAPLRSPSM
jgi:hypothetical protein